MIKKFLGYFLIVASLALYLENKIIGFVISENSIQINYFKFLLLFIFLVGSFLVFSSSLEERVAVKEKPTIVKRIKNNLASRAVAASIFGLAGGYALNKTGDMIQPYAKDAETSVQVANLFGRGLTPGTTEYNNRAVEHYLSQTGEEGLEYLKNSQRKSEEGYLREIGDSIRLAQDSLGRVSDKASSSTMPTKKFQQVQNKIYEKVGSILGAEGMSEKNSEQYRTNYETIAKQRINAVILLHQLRNQIKDYSAKIASRGHKEVGFLQKRHLNNLTKEANRVYSYLENEDKLSYQDIFSGDVGYLDNITQGAEIPPASTPYSDKLPFYLGLAGSVIGASYGAAKHRKLGEKTIKTVKRIKTRRR